MKTQDANKAISSTDSYNEVIYQEERELLKRLREQAFDDKDEELAIALGRPVQEVRAWFNGEEQIDEDVLIKAHGLLRERGF